MEIKTAQFSLSMCDCLFFNVQYFHHKTSEQCQNLLRLNETYIMISSRNVHDRMSWALSTRIRPRSRWACRAFSVLRMRAHVPIYRLVSLPPPYIPSTPHTHERMFHSSTVLVHKDKNIISGEISALFLIRQSILEQDCFIFFLPHRVPKRRMYNRYQHHNHFLKLNWCAQKINTIHLSIQ